MPFQTKKNKTTDPAEPQTQYLIERGTEKLKITVPSSWKVTFGPIVPGKSDNRRGYGAYEAPNCLRFYESNDKQRAIFTGVTGFRDLSIKVEKMIVEIAKVSESKKTNNKENSSASVEYDEKWIDA
jgi:hypothetical protein